MFSSIDPIARNIIIITTILTGFMVLEHLWFFRIERRLIWPKFWKSARSKSYVLTRYAGLVGQIFNVCFAFRMASDIPNNVLVCQVWYSYQTAMIQYMLFAVEIPLMVGVYKMYKKAKSIYALLFIFGGAQAAAMAVNARTIVNGTLYTPTCITITNHHNRIYVGVSIIATFMFILFAMLWRYFRDTSSWSEAPRAWLNLVVRDGGLATIAITAIFIFMFLCTMGTIDTQMSRNFVFYILLTCLWFFAGRIVLHQEKFCESHESQKSGAHDSSQWTMTVEVDPDDFGPLDPPDACPESAPDLKVDSTEVPNLSDSESDVGTKDITDERVCELEEEDDNDDVSLSSCPPTFVLMERRVGAEGSGSRP